MKSTLVVIACVLALVSCGPTTYQMVSLPTAPGADATLKAKIKKGSRVTLLELEIKNLPPPERVAEDAKYFVAWYRTGPDEAWRRIGSLDYDEDSREAEMNASTPEVEFDFEISAEEIDTGESPSPAIVFTQHVED